MTQPKLFKIWESDGNDRDTYAHVKANDIDQVIEWLKQTYFKPEALSLIEVDISSNSDAIIIWNDCGDCENKDKNDKIKSIDCELCEIISNYLEIQEIEQPTQEDYEFKTIYGTNEYYDLTQHKPVKAPNWDNQLAETWLKNPQEGANMLLIKSLIEMPKMLIGHNKEFDTYQLNANGQLLQYFGKTKEDFINPDCWKLVK